MCASEVMIFCRALRYTKRMREEANPYGCVAINSQGWTICTGVSEATAPLVRCAMGTGGVKKARPPPGGGGRAGHGAGRGPTHPPWRVCQRWTTQ